MVHSEVEQVGLPAHSTTGEQAKQVRRVVASGFLGTLVEYYDFLLYSMMAALVIGPLFFPTNNPGVSTIAAFGTLAAGYVARPLGAVLFGHFGDRRGRKSMLVTTMTLMGVASVLIGVLPTYNTIGIAAPLMLVFLRLVQGVALGGEFGGAVLMVVEHAHPRRRGATAGVLQMGAALGFVLATGVIALVTLLPVEDFQSWGWRLPFLFSAVLLVIGLYVRLSVAETPVFREAVAVAATKARASAPLLQLLRRPRALLLACAAGIGPYVTTALVTSHMVAYTTGIGYEISDVVRLLLVTSLMTAVGIPLCGALSDRLGRRTVVLMGAIGAIVYALPLYALINTRSVSFLFIAFVGAALVFSFMYAPLSPLFSEMFGTRVRYTGVAVGHAIASLIGAGFTPLIAASLVVAFGGSSIPLSAMIMIACAITVLAIWRISETRGRDLNEDTAGPSA